MIGPIMPGVPRVKFNASTVNIVCDGNSLTQGVGNPSAPYPSMLASLAPLNGTIPVTNLGVSGNTIGQMISAARPDPYWVAGKTNILAVWPGTNEIYGGSTAAQAVQDLKTYIAARKALHPWIVVLLTCLPRQQSTEAASITLNATLNTYNATLRASYRDIGADALVDVQQPGSPFAFSDYTDATFAAAFATGLWAPSESPHVHLSGYGYFKIASMVAAALKRLPAR